MNSIILLIFISYCIAAEENGDVSSCRKGYYLDDKGNCEECLSGYYCPDGVNMIECPDGTYSTLRQSVCDKCGCVDDKSCQKYETYKIPGNTRIENIETFAGSCNGPCKEGIAYDYYTGMCKPCTKGFYCPGGYNGSLMCPTHFVPNANQTGCVECNGTLASIRGVCQPCPDGQYFNVTIKDCKY